MDSYQKFLNHFAIEKEALFDWGIEATIFLCRATVRGEKWLFELRYTIRSHSWCLLRKVC